MDKLTSQFFGDAKRLQLSSAEKSAVWHQIATQVTSKQVSLTNLEKADAFTRIAHHMRSHPITGDVRSHWGFAFPKIFAGAMALLVLVAAGGGTVVYAAEGAMPEDLLYPIKVHVTEPVIEVLQRTPEQKAQWEALRLERRFKEAEHLLMQEKLSDERRIRLEQNVEKRMKVLEQHMEVLPDERKEEIYARIDARIEKYEQTIIWKHSEDVRKEAKVAKEEKEAKEMKELEKEELEDLPAGEAGAEELEESEEFEKTKMQRNEEINTPKAPALRVQSSAEGWLSGRKRTTRNRVDSQESRGFESPSLRHSSSPPATTQWRSSSSTGADSTQRKSTSSPLPDASEKSRNNNNEGIERELGKTKKLPEEEKIPLPILKEKLPESKDSFRL